MIKNEKIYDDLKTNYLFLKKQLTKLRKEIEEAELTVPSASNGTIRSPLVTVYNDFCKQFLAVAKAMKDLNIQDDEINEADKFIKRIK